MQTIRGDSLSSEGVQVVAHIAVRARSALHTLAEDTVDGLAGASSRLEEVDGIPRRRGHRGEEEQHHAGEAEEESWDSLRSRQLLIPLRFNVAVAKRKTAKNQIQIPLPGAPQQAADKRRQTLTGDAMVVSLCVDFLNRGVYYKSWGACDIQRE